MLLRGKRCGGRETHTHTRLKCRRYKVKAPDCIRSIAAHFSLQYVVFSTHFNFFLQIIISASNSFSFLQIGQIPSVSTVMV